MITAIVQRVAAGQDLTFDEMAAVMDPIMRGACPAEQVASLLMALRAKGETVDEIAGAAAALRNQMTPIPTTRRPIVDTCGTGGGGSGTLNISTAAALVAAAGGAVVAKHGNRRVTSRSGSADVLAELGVNIEAPVATVQRCLDQLGIAFCFAPQLHPSMRNVAEIRSQLGVPTIFNLLGPLCNPAGAQFQLLGVGRAPLRPLLAAALQRLGTQRALVVCGEDGLGEVTIGGATYVTEVTADGLREMTWTPADFHLQPATLDAIKADSPADSAARIREVLAGNRGPARDVVVMNAAATLWLCNLAASLPAAAEQAAEAIDSGAASQLLERLAEASHQ